MQYAALARVLRELGESSLADEAEAKAQEAGHHHGSSFFGPFHHDRQRPPSVKPETKPETGESNKATPKNVP